MGVPAFPGQAPAVPRVGGGKRKALVIAIDYKETNVTSRRDRGLTDVKNMMPWLRKNFTGAEYVMLSDEPILKPNAMPTRLNIMKALRWLVEDAQPGDILFLYYSGHGSAVSVSERGSDDPGEATNQNQTLVPC
eukprot:389923_1